MKFMGGSGIKRYKFRRQRLDIDYRICDGKDTGNYISSANIRQYIQYYCNSRLQTSQVAFIEKNLEI